LVNEIAISRLSMPVNKGLNFLESQESARQHGNTREDGGRNINKRQRGKYL